MKSVMSSYEMRSSASAIASAHTQRYATAATTTDNDVTKHTLKDVENTRSAFMQTPSEKDEQTFRFELNVALNVQKHVCKRFENSVGTTQLHSMQLSSFCTLCERLRCITAIQPFSKHKGFYLFGLPMTPSYSERRSDIVLRYFLAIPIKGRPSLPIEIMAALCRSSVGVFQWHDLLKH
uniref:Uncharacterized protein n=1 Tax=Glossina pallidipes TaxID=7398 RepID=A0A1B0ADS6_GLOPL